MEFSVLPIVKSIVAIPFIAIAFFIGFSHVNIDFWPYQKDFWK